MIQRLRRLQRKRRLRSRAAPGPPAPFIVGVGRSGTTLLRMMLDSHPELTIPPETHFVPELVLACERVRVTPKRLVAAVVEEPHRRWGDMGIDESAFLARLRTLRPLNTSDAVRAFYQLYAERAGKPRWGDKTPDYLKRMGRISRALPEAHFIHLIRDGRDVMLSYNKRLVLRGKSPASPRIRGLKWRNQITRARQDAKRLPHYLEIRYEDLVLETEATLKRVCEYIELSWDPAMLSYHERAAERLAEMDRDLPALDDRPARPGEERLRAHALTTEPPKPDRVYAWREELSEEDLALFESEAGGMLADLGYEITTPAVAASTDAGASGVPS